MMKGRGDYAATAHSSMAIFEPGRLSVPESVHDGPGLLALLPASEKERLESFLDKMLRSPEEVAQLEEELGPPGRHTDPKLNHRRTYLRFIALLHEIGLVKFVKRCRERVVVFVGGDGPASKSALEEYHGIGLWTFEREIAA